MDDNASSERLSTRLFYWWADNPSKQILVFAVLTSLAIVGYVRPSLIRDLFIDPENFEEPDYLVHQLRKPSDLQGSNPAILAGVDDEVHSAGDTPLDVTLVSRLAKREQQRSARPSEQVRPFQLGGGDNILVAIADDSDPRGFFTPGNLRAIHDVCAALEELPQVHDVTWLNTVPGLNLFGLSGTLVPSPNASPRQMEEARERALDNPLTVGQLISPDGNTLLIHVRFDWFHVRSDEAVTSELRELAERITADTEGASVRYMVTGRTALHLMVANNHVTNSVKYQAIGYTIMMISAFVLFRGFSAVMIVAIAPGVGVFWTMGFLHFINVQDNPFNAIIVPVLISLVGLTDSVHLMVEIRQQRALADSQRNFGIAPQWKIRQSGLPGPDTAAAMRRAVARVGMACLLTSATTAIGFLSLMTAHHQVVQDFGWSCVVGVLMTFVSVLTVIPLGCRSPLGRRIQVGYGQSLIDGQLRKIGPLVEWVLRRHKAVSMFAIISTASLIAIALQLVPDERRYSGLSESGEAARALRHLDRVLGGLEFGQVHVEWQVNDDNGQLLDVMQLKHYNVLLMNGLFYLDGLKNYQVIVGQHL